VAAVLGVVITMGALGGPPEEIGHKVAAALVGTFLGILLCYGLVGPMAARMGKNAEEEHSFLLVMRVVMVAFLKGVAPIMAVEIGRRVMPTPPIIVIKKKGGHGGHHGGAWKVAYADFVTAMMALFIVLWLMNSSKPIQAAISGYFKDPSGTGKLTGSSLKGLNQSGSSMAGAGEDFKVTKENM